MPPAALLLAGACLAGAAVPVFILARFGWVRTTRATILALVMLLIFTFWQAGRAEDMRGLGLIVTATLMILPATVGSLAGALLGSRRRHGADAS